MGCRRHALSPTGVRALDQAQNSSLAPFQRSKISTFLSSHRHAMANQEAASSSPSARASPYQIAAEASLCHADRLTSEHRRAICTIIFDLMRADPGIRQIRDMATPPLDLRWHVNSTALRRATESIALFLQGLHVRQYDTIAPPAPGIPPVIFASSTSPMVAAPPLRRRASSAPSAPPSRAPPSPGERAPVTPPLPPRPNKRRREQ